MVIAVGGVSKLKCKKDVEDCVTKLEAINTGRSVFAIRTEMLCVSECEIKCVSRRLCVAVNYTGPLQLMLQSQILCKSLLQVT